MKVLNLYAGLGGNRKLWPDHFEVTAIESNEKIAAEYQRMYPNDKVIIADAHEYLLNNFRDYDFIWSSPPCQSHSKMVKATRHKINKYPSMDLYQQVILLQHLFKGKWVVENVKPYYDFLIDPSQTIGRHVFWSNLDLNNIEDVKRPENFINKSNLSGMKDLMKWLDIHIEKPIYYDGNHCPCQVFRNCVHPLIGKQISERITL